MNRMLLSMLFPALIVTLPLFCRAEEKVFRLGMIGLDTSHVIAFTSYLNNPNNKAGGRVGTFRDLRKGKSGHTAIIYGTKGSATGKSSGYAPLLKQIVEFFKTGKPPVPENETIEIFAFMSAADESKAAGGKAISIPELIEKARGKR